MRKLLATLAVAVTATAALAGCSTSSSSTDSNGHIDLTFWHGYTEADGKVLDGIVDDYNKSQDKVTIKTQVKTWDVIDDTLLTALSANKGPQIVAMPAERLPVYASKKALANLDDFYADDKNAAEISEQAAAMETVDGAKYGVPTGFVPLSVFYNKTLFEAAGVTEFPETWDEWVDAAKKLTVDQDGDGTPEQYGLALADHATVGNGVWPSLFAGNGGEIVDDSKSVIDSPENVETLEYWSKALNDDKISPTGLDGVATDKLFSSGKAAMTIGGPWMASVSTENKIDYGIAAIPAGPVAQASSGIGVSMAVTAQASPEEQKAAQDFFSYFFSKDVATEWSLGSGWPPLRTDVPAADVSSNPVVASLTDISSTTKALLPGVINSTDVLSAMDEVTQKAMAGGDPNELLGSASTAIDKALKD
ncbi:ABC transporter substrate-binding protein [Okibacterium fritillariae]|uniref:Carbohydrate ABC transporter substrate-binding protein, CUT1 family n=1 Tax=Okibacterium fritillariae TaxID=123320 RepID=A0A1T5IF44_9MICO|nr:ABC transporter substrate-binding protein [Okibacterium fritillariae]SKC37710.1 carbohydrate ABC transporter substrate-binding protein, CUT1 family [Okibacterium fritillariae]